MTLTLHEQIRDAVMGRMCSEAREEIATFRQKYVSALVATAELKKLLDRGTNANIAAGSALPEQPPANPPPIQSSPADVPPPAPEKPQP